MKYKLWGAVLCLCAIGLSFVASLLEQETSTRFHQHRDAPVKMEDAEQTGAFSTHLPLVEISTDGVEIPGRAVLEEDGSVFYTTAADGAIAIRAHMDIVDHRDTYNHAGDAPDISTDIMIHIRGESSRFYDKSNYAVRLVHADGSNNPQPVMGMDAHHEWVLHGPYLDKTLMRNYMWYNIGGEIMDYAPNVRFCEVILNGMYRGVYVMTETITAGDNGARLGLTVSAKRNTFGGYLLQLNGDRRYGVLDRSIDQFTHYAKRIRFRMDIEFPGSRNLTPEMQEAITRDFSAFEKSLYSYDYDHEDYGYAKQIDVESFMDFFLINELTCNYDAGWLSTFMYKDPSGTFHMCLWDMNSACDNYLESQTEPMLFQMQECLWFWMLFKDEDFTSALIDRYRELRKTYFDLDYLFRYIDDTVAFLGPAIERNYGVWGHTFLPEADLLSPTERNPRSYEASVQQLKDFLEKRIAWMDENIDTLRQYSTESRVKKFNENAN